MIVAFIGSDYYTRTPQLVVRMWETLSGTLTVDRPNIFMFNNANFFDCDCRMMVSQLKMHNRTIEMHYYHGGYDYDIGYFNYFDEYFDKVFFPKMGVVFPCQLRNCLMIDRCEVLITFCSDDELRGEPKSLTALAIEYAKQKKKRIINLYY